MVTVRCENVCKSFDGVEALNGVRVQFWPSKVNAVIGPNGAGKTTLLNVISGFVRADEGACFLNDCDITHWPPHKIARLGISRTFQDVRLIFRVTVWENILLAFSEQHGESLLGAIVSRVATREEQRNKERGLQLLEFVGLQRKAAERTASLSYGEQKLLTIACCRATEAQVLLLDEPIAGIHPEMITQILDLLCKLRDQGKTVVFIEHNITAVRSISDHIVLMSAGRIVAEGTPMEILDRSEIMEAYLG
jgi:ABC-type branched-subunit amino acid transport system ATPase component